MPTSTYYVYRYTATPFSLVNLLVDLVEALLALRFVFKFFSANAAHWFVTALYGISDPLVRPFQGIFPNASAGGFFFEWATLLAMIGYALLALIVVRLLNLLASAIIGEEEEMELADHRRHRHHVHHHA